MNQVDPHDECHIDILSIFTLDPLCHQCDITCAFSVQILYSGLFVRFAWAVQPRNYILASCLELSPWIYYCHVIHVDPPKKTCPNFSGHTANVLAQSNQLRRCVVMTTQKTGSHQRRGFFSIELGIYIYVDLMEFQL